MPAAAATAMAPVDSTVSLIDRITTLESRNAQLSTLLQQANAIVSTLRETDARARLVVDTLPAAVAYFDADGLYRFTNLLWDNWFFKDGDAFGAAALGGNGTVTIDNILKQTMGSGAYHIDADMICADGATRHLSLQTHPQYADGATGRLTCICLIAYDITEQYAAEIALRDREELFSLAMRGPNEGLWDWNPISKELYLSARLLAILGFEGDTLRTTSHEWLKLVHPDDRRHYEVTVSRHLKGQSDHFECEYRVSDRDGNYRWILARGLALRNSAGIAHRMVGSIGDITDMKAREQEVRASEARFRAIVDVAGNIFLVVDRDGLIHEANREAQRVLSGDDGEIVGLPWYRVLGEASGGDFGRQLFSVACGRPVRGFEHRLHPETGDFRVLLWNIDRFENTGPNGREILLICAGQDITARKTAELALQRANEVLELRVAERTSELTQEIAERRRAETDLILAKEMAEVANRAKSEFLANMSHELRTPLNAIIGFSEMMSSEMLGPMGNPKYIEYAGVVSQSAHHLLEVINDILDVSKIEAGRFTLNPGPMDLTDAADSSMMLVSERAETGGVRLEKQYASDLPQVLGDMVRVKQILLNLLSNAVKFTDVGGTVTLSLDRADTAWVVASVVDTGCGMEPDQLKVALEPFGQVDNHMTRKAGGTGLGLPLARRLTEMHGGRFRIASRRGHGTTVEVALPVCDGDICPDIFQMI